MPNRAHVERLLKVNGLSPAAPEEEIRSVLLSAHFRAEEVDMALLVLRENTKTNQSTVSAAHKIFRSDGSLSPADISKLLGIDVDVSTLAAARKRLSTSRRTSVPQMVSAIGLALLVALAGLVFAMYYFAFGPFHPTAAILIFYES